jgi:type VI secretion system protein ImpD
MKVMAKHQINYMISKIDEKISRQLQLILATSEFKNILSLWTELALLCSSKNDNHLNIKLKLFDIQWSEIDKDLNAALDLDESVLFQFIYEQEIGLAGGEPFSLLIANYELDLRKINIVSTLSRLGDLAAYALAPLITNVSVQTFNEDSFDLPVDFSRQLNTTNLNAWYRARQNPQSRFINAVVPTAQLTPIGQHHDFITHQSIDIHGACLLALRIIRSFEQTQWFNEILGFFDTIDMLPDDFHLPFMPKNIEINNKLFINSEDEKKLAQTGFISLMQDNKNKSLYFGNIYCSFLGSDTSGLLLEHLLCACRFAHHIKIIARDKIGLHTDEKECENFVSKWLQRYTANLPTQSLRYQYPLKSYQVKLSKIPGKSGYYTCQILLEPHMKLENMNTQIVLHSEILSPK